MAAHALDAIQKFSSGQKVTPGEKSTPLMAALKVVELWD
jgi:hypothetical protein